MQVKHTVLYLHHPLKHMGQREEGDEHVFIAGLQCALDSTHREEQDTGQQQFIENQQESDFLFLKFMNKKKTAQCLHFVCAKSF